MENIDELTGWDFLRVIAFACWLIVKSRIRNIRK